MPDISYTICGIYPKLIESPDVPHLKRNLHAFDDKQITAERLEEVINENSLQVIHEQREAGVNIVSDGLVRWDDFFSPFAKAWEGIERGTLKRIFDTNTLQRLPRVTGEIVYQPSTALVDASVAKQNIQAGEQLKTTIPGPITFAEDCDDEHYQDFKSLALAIASALNKELQALAESGISIVEVYDPWLHFTEIESEILKDVYEELLKNTSIKVIIGSFYGTVLEKNLSAILPTGLSGVSLDLVSNPESTDWLPADYKPEIVQLGVFDARTTAKDNVDQAKALLSDIQDKYPEASLWVALNNSTEFLPRDRANRKISELTQL